MARVLLIDDSELILQMLDMVCTQAGHETVRADTFAVARRLYAEESPDVVVTDLNLPECSDPVSELRELGSIPIIVVSGRSKAELDAFAEERGLVGAISKDAGLPGMASSLPELIDDATG